MKATPGGQAEFQFQGLKKRLHMIEVNSNLGIYAGSYQFQPGETLDDAALRFFFKGPAGSRATAVAKGKVTVRSDPAPVAVVVGGAASVKTAPNSGYMMFL